MLSLIAGGQIPEELPPPGSETLAPPDADVALERATELCKQKRYQTCVQQCQQVVQWRPREARAYSIWGRALVGLGEYGKALRCYRKAIALEPKNGLWHQELGELCLQQRRYPEAIVSLQEAVLFVGSYPGETGTGFPGGMFGWDRGYGVGDRKLRRSLVIRWLLLPTPTVLRLINS